MATVVKQGFANRRYPRYPWAQWTNGKAYSAKRSESDYKCSDAGFIATLHTYAKRQGLDVATSNPGEGEVLFRFTKPKPKKRAKKK